MAIQNTTAIGTPIPQQTPDVTTTTPDTTAPPVPDLTPLEPNPQELELLAAAIQQEDPQADLRNIAPGAGSVSVSQLQTVLNTSHDDGPFSANAMAFGRIGSLPIDGPPPDLGTPEIGGARVEDGQIVREDGSIVPQDQWLVPDNAGGFRGLEDGEGVPGVPVQFNVVDGEIQAQVWRPSGIEPHVENFGASRDYDADPVQPRTYEALEDLGLTDMIPNRAFQPHLGGGQSDDPGTQIRMNFRRRVGESGQLEVRKILGGYEPIGLNKMTDGLGNMVRQQIFGGLFDPNTMTPEELQRGIQSGWLDGYFQDTAYNTGGPFENLNSPDFAGIRARAGEPEFLELLQTAHERALNGESTATVNKRILEYLGVAPRYLDPNQRRRANNNYLGPQFRI